MAIYIGDFWIDETLLSTIIVGAVLLAGLWWASRKSRVNKEALEKTKGKQAATPMSSGLQGRRGPGDPDR